VICSQDELPQYVQVKVCNNLHRRLNTGLQVVSPCQIVSSAGKQGPK